MIAWVKIHANPSRTVMIATQRARVEMIRHGGDKRFIIFWHAEIVGWIICWKQGVEKTVEFASAYETDVADLHRPIRSPRTWLPQGMSVRRILDCKLFAEDVVVGHRGWQLPQEPRNLSRPVGVGRGTVLLYWMRTACLHPKMADQRLLRPLIDCWLLNHLTSEKRRTI